MLTPFLLIGVGGSGGKTLRAMRVELRQRLDRVGYQGPWPRAWQLLHIDVPTYPDGESATFPSLPTGAYRGLVEPGVTYRDLDHALTAGKPVDSAQMRALLGWRPNANRVGVAVENGAGQYRAVGRIVSIAHLDEVRDALSRAQMAMSGAEVIGELGAVAERFGGKPSAEAPGRTAVVISSMAGGAGAGIFQDVCDMLRASGESWAADSIGVLYAPDVFNYLPPGSRKGVAANSLATLSEILAGFWGDGPGPDSMTLLSKAGIASGSMRRSGPRYVFAVGSRNSKVTYPTQDDVYESMGKAMAAWVSSERIQDTIRSAVQGNWQASAAGEDRLPLRSPGQESVLSALGYGRVLLGMQRFEAYASEWLARAAVDRVLRRHEQTRDRDDVRPAQALIDEAADALFVGFLRRSGLNEEGREADDVIDAIRDPQRQVRIEGLKAQLRERLQAVNPNKRRKIAVIVQDIWSGYEGLRQDVLQAERSEQDRLALTWCDAIQDRLAEAVSATAAEHGLPITSELLARLLASVENSARSLHEEAEQEQRGADSDRGMLESELTSGRAKELLVTDEAVERALAALGRCTAYAAEADLKRLCGRLLKDLSGSLLKPMIQAVEFAAQRVAIDEAPASDGRPSDVGGWPKDDALPKRFRPAANEQLVLSVEDYPQTFRELLKQATQASSDTDAKDRALQDVILGLGAPRRLRGDGASAPAPVVMRERAWVPAEDRLQLGNYRSPQKAAFSISLRPEVLLERARRWVVNDETALGRFVGQSFADYLDPDKAPSPADHQKRMERFRKSLTAARMAAEPLVGVDTQALQRIHGVDTATSMPIFSEMPFAEGTPGRRLVESVLGELDSLDARTKQAFTDLGSHESIDIFSCFSQPYSPMVFDSLVDPILAEWESRKDSAEPRSEFWRWRRARTLPDYVPTSPGVRECMVRGWFTATLLGQVRREDAGALSIFCPAIDSGAAGAYAQFPFPFLGATPTQAHDFLPAVLKSLPLAMLYFAKQGEPAVAAYRRLRTLGTAGGGEESNYPHVNEEVKGWVLSGRLPKGAPDVPGASPTATALDRRDDLRARIDEARSRYEHLIKSALAAGDFFAMPHLVELRDDVLGALDELWEALEREDLRQPTGGGNVVGL